MTSNVRYMPDPPSYSLTFDAPFNPQAWRILAGSRRCGFCDTPIGLFTVCEEDDNGMPIPDRPTGEHRYEELVEGAFCVTHTAQRCVEARSKQ